MVVDLPTPGAPVMADPDGLAGVGQQRLPPDRAPGRLMIASPTFDQGDRPRQPPRAWACCAALWPRS